MSIKPSICIATALLLLSAALHSATLYRCDSESTAPVFQQFPCAGSGQVLDVAPISTTGDALRPAEKAKLASYAKTGKTKKVVRQVAEEEDKEEKRCFDKRKRLEQVQARLRAGYKASSGKDLRRKRAEYEDYLSQFCH